MASEQAIANEVIAKAAVEATRAAIQAMAAAMAERPHSTAGLKIGRPAMKQPTFNWETDDKYSELKTFRLEVNINIQHTSYRTAGNGKKNCPGRKGLQFIGSLTSTEKDTCYTLECLFKILTNKFRPQFNETIKSLQFHKLSRQYGEMLKNWW